jgi:16S rRNA G1207 methylase RsmC
MAHYYEAKQNSPLGEEKLRFIVLDRHFELKTASGLFSRDQLDHASRTLIEVGFKEISSSSLENPSVLDLGCGWGGVAVTLKTALPQISVVAVDTNERAVTYTRKNLDKNKLEGRVFISDAFTKIGEETFDYILTNPPYAAGRAVCYQFIEESFTHLNAKGVFLLVARHQKGGKMLEKHIEEIFGNVETLAKSGGFRVYKGVKK